MNSTVCSFRRCEVFFCFCPPFLKLLFATGTRCSGKEGSVGCGTFCCIFCGEVLVLDFRDGEACFLFSAGLSVVL